MRNCDIRRTRKVPNQFVINNIKHKSIFENKSSIVRLDQTIRQVHIAKSWSSDWLNLRWNHNWFKWWSSKCIWFNSHESWIWFKWNGWKWYARWKTWWTKNFNIMRNCDMRRPRKVPNQFVINNIKQKSLLQTSLRLSDSIKHFDKFRKRNADPSIDWTWDGITIDWSDEYENARDSICINREFDSKGIEWNFLLSLKEPAHTRNIDSETQPRVVEEEPCWRRARSISYFTKFMPHP
jgi:hypothetical protein